MGKIGARLALCGGLATGFIWLYLYAGMGPTPLVLDGVDGSFLRIFVSLGLIVFYLIAFFVPSVLGRRSVRVSLTASLAAVLAVIGLVEALEPAIFSSGVLVYLMYLFQGICLGFAYGQMGVFLFLLDGRTAAVALATAMSAAGAGSLVLGFINALWISGALKVFLIASMVLFLCVPFSEETRVQPRRMFTEFAETRPLFSELFFISILYGFMVMFATGAILNGTTGFLGLGLSYLVPALVLLLLVVVFNKRIGFLSLRWFVVPAMTVIIVPLTIVPPGEGVLFLAAVLALFQVLEASTSLSLAEIAREHGMPPISAFVLLRLVGTVGLLIGRVVYTGVSASAADVDWSFKVAVVVIIVVLVLWRTLMSSRVMDGRAGGVEEAELSAPKESPDIDWQEKRDLQLQQLSEAHGLSEREAEVFRLLARGRNAEYIGTLLYVSENTIRSHIQRIYRKIGVHSQQDLLDVVEGVKPQQR